MAEVKETSGGCEENRKFSGTRCPPRWRGHSLVSFRWKSTANRKLPVVVAKTAGAILEIRFRVRDGVAVFGVAGPSESAQLLGDGVTCLAQDRSRERVTWWKTAGGGEIVRRRKSGGRGGPRANSRLSGSKLARFLYGTGAGTGTEVYIPHALDDGPQRPLGTAPRCVRQQRQNRTSISE